MSVSAVSAVGSSLATSGSVPSAGAASTSAAVKPPSTYQTEFANLNQQDTAELLYASFLSPSDSLSNGNAVLSQAAQLLGTPGALPAQTTTSSPSSSAAASSTATSTATTAPAAVPSVSSIISASDAAAQQALAAYAQAPAGASILDYQA